MIGNALRSTTLVSRSSARFASTLDPKIAAKMKKFQKNINGEVYLMGGATDKILFGISCVGVAIGSAWSFSVLYKMASSK